MFAQKRLQSHVQMSSEIHNRPTLHEAENYKIPKTTESQAAEMAHHDGFPENPASIPHSQPPVTSPPQIQCLTYSSTCTPHMHTPT